MSSELWYHLTEMGRVASIRSMKEQRLLTITQAASRLGVNQKTLRRWADAGRVPHVKTLAGQRRFEVSVIERLRREMGFTDGENTNSG
jgi:excisionase family DNA binding protein